MGANCMRFAEYIKDQKRNILCFILAFGTYLLNRCVLQAHTQNGVRYFCQCYLNDMLCPLCFLPLVDMGRMGSSSFAENKGCSAADWLRQLDLGRRDPCNQPKVGF